MNTKIYQILSTHKDPHFWTVITRFQWIKINFWNWSNFNLEQGLNKESRIRMFRSMNSSGNLSNLRNISNHSISVLPNASISFTTQLLCQQSQTLELKTHGFFQHWIQRSQTTATPRSTLNTQIKRIILFNKNDHINSNLKINMC